MEVEVTVTQTGLHCSRHILVKSETVAHQGLMVVGRTRSSKLSAPIQPVPGRIVFVARPSSLLEKVLFD
jgi:hypothetical protein